MQEFFSRSENDTLNIAKEFASHLKGGEVIAFIGGLGMGKTAFVRGALLGMNNDSRVSSPTFALVNEYRGAHRTLYHFDMYRISGWDDLYSTGYFDYLDAGGCLIIEWSENIEAILPENCIRVCITKTENVTERKIEITGAEGIENISV